MDSRLLATKSVFRGEFPLTAEFRSGPRGWKPSYEDWVDQQNMPEGYPVDLQTNVLRFAPENYKYANRFAEEHPETMILSTWRAASGMPKGAPDDGDPLGVSTIEFPGHWVLSPGTILVSSISSTDETFYVESTVNMRKGPALLVEVDGSGNKIWENFEYVLIRSVGDNSISVKREYNGSPAARVFSSGSTYIAPIPWDDRNRRDFTDWFFNLSEYCPRDPQGRTAMDILLQDMVRPLERGGPLENIGGLDLASGPLTVNPEFADYDLDGVADQSSIYRDGIETFYGRIRQILGPDRVLTTSLDYEYLEYINGVNQEGLANPDDPWEEVTRTVNNVLAWQKLAQLPIVSLAFQQHMDREEDLLRVQLQRLLSGYSVCLGMAADIETGSGSAALDAIKRIELYKGDEKEPHWLGKSVGVKRPASMTPNLLNGANSPTDWDNMMPALSVLRGELFIDGDELVLRPDSGDFPGYVTLDINFNLGGKSDFTVFMEAKSDDDQLKRDILLPRVSVPVDSGPVRADLTSKAYLPLSFYVRGAMPGSVTIDFRFGDGGDIRFKSLSVHAAADTLACEFERGVVLVNPSLQDVSLDLPKIFPGRGGYQRLSASEPEGANDIPDEYRPQLRQAMEMNNGERIESLWPLQIPQRNALFLIANEIGAVDDANGYSVSPQAPTFTEESNQSTEDEPGDIENDSGGASASTTAEEEDTNADLAGASASTVEKVQDANVEMEDARGPTSGWEFTSMEGGASASTAAEVEDTNTDLEGASASTVEKVQDTNTETKDGPTSEWEYTPTESKNTIASTVEVEGTPTELQDASTSIAESEDASTESVDASASTSVLKDNTAESEDINSSNAETEDSNANIEDVSVSNTVVEEPDFDGTVDLLAAQTEESTSKQKSISMGDLGAIIAFAAVSVILAICFYAWRKRRTSRWNIRGSGRASKRSRHEEIPRDTVVIGHSFSGHDSSSGSDSSAEIVESGRCIPFPTSNETIFEVTSAQRDCEAVEVSIARSIHEAANATQQAVEAGLWPDDVMPLGSFSVPASGSMRPHEQFR